MKFKLTPQFYKILEEAKTFLVIVEGKKDKTALKSIGFQSIFVLNEKNKSLNEKIEQIEQEADKNPICILTDFDKKGKQLYLKLKTELSTKGVKQNNKLRQQLLKAGLSHIEGIDTFLTE